MAAQYEVPAWGGSLYEDVTVPSGGTILAKRLDFADIISAGLLDEFDSLSPIVNDKVVGPANGKAPQDRKPKKLTKAQEAQQKAEKTSKMLGDQELMKGLAKILALIIPLVVVKPEISSNLVKGDDGNWVPIAPDARVAGVIYIDSIPLGDRMYILSWCMEGMDLKSLESFREQPESDLGALESEPKSADSA